MTSQKSGDMNVRGPAILASSTQTRHKLTNSPDIESSSNIHGLYCLGVAGTLPGMDSGDVSAWAGTQKPVLFFDIDNCLYSRDLGVQDLLPNLMNAYFEKHLSLPKEEAARLQRDYSRQYGQAIQGLVRHHQIDPLDYNTKVDDALPLEELIKPDPRLRQFLESIDTSKVRLWLLTNAYVNHATRVVRLLGVNDLFEGLTYCDYAQVPLVCKPQEEMFRKAMREAGVLEDGNCYFVDDSYSNCAGAGKAGWTAIHYLEKDLPDPSEPAGEYCIRSLEQLRDVLPQFFKTLS